MKKIMLLGKTFCGKTTLIRALRRETLGYQKTQAIDYIGDFVDTPGEYLEIPRFYRALLVTSYNCDIICFVQDATGRESLFPPQFSSAFQKPVLGVITKLDHPWADAARVEAFLKLAGAERIFCVSAFDGMGINELRAYLQMGGAEKLEV